jgi:hypothetical protein
VDHKEFASRIFRAFDALQTEVFVNESRAGVIVTYDTAEDLARKSVTDLTVLAAVFDGTDVSVSSFDGGPWERFMNKPFALRVFFSGVAPVTGNYGVGNTRAEGGS